LSHFDQFKNFIDYEKLCKLVEQVICSLGKIGQKTWLLDESQTYCARVHVMQV